ncbi:NADPH-dependent ferric siderophore reductase [Amycolatopsis antarctica]|uniref:NADPH-dependent ferric siderophore reductase n=1 Tax=Amycolatopsis antarctica TaxID=1854586 RepID=A0A263CZC3_9PSEU|nr:siderophore-interacting protein [Amycolatopsis antarctica]OZM71238.1 NADPH-dependent ferric siderophore reductase [Amycolatopsis antarctica]
MTIPASPAATGTNRTGELQHRFQPAIVRRDLRVSRVEEITLRYRRIVLTGDVLAQGYPFVRFACNDHVKVYFPNPRTGQIVAYRETAGGGWEPDSDSGAPIRRDYTPRAWNPEARELTVDFVLHEHGVAGVWASRAVPGDELVVMGPRANWLLPENYPHYLAAGDETAIPAISRLVEEAPPGARVTAVIEVADPAEEQRLTVGAGVDLDLRWVHRDTAPVEADHGSALETAVRRIDLPEDPDALYAFAAGEAGTMKPIRRYLRNELGLPGRQTCVDGYWKRGTADHDHHTSEPDDEN